MLIDIGIPWASLQEVESVPVEYRDLPTRRYREEPYVDVLNRVYTDDIGGLRERLRKEEVSVGFVKALTNKTYDDPDSQFIVDNVVRRVEKVKEIIQDFEESGVYYPVWVVEDTDGLLRVADGNHRAAALSIQYPEASMPTWVSSL